MFGSGSVTFITSNKEMTDIMKIVKSLEEPGLLIKGVSETLKMKPMNKKDYFLKC